MGLFLYARFVEPNLIISKKVTIKGDRDLKDLKIVMFGDTHFGEYYNSDKAKRITEKINKQKADVVIFTGDLFDSYAKFTGSEEDIVDEFSKIEARYGKYAIFGNHDNGGGAARIYEDLMERCGFEVLKNQTFYNEEIGVNFIGIDDSLLGDPNLNIVEEYKADAYNLLLAHEPDLVKKIDLSNIQLVLSGHTHGGQVKLPILTKRVLPPGGQTYIEGQYTLDTAIKTKLYVTTGLGMTQLPFRLGNIPEVVVLTIGN